MTYIVWLSSIILWRLFTKSHTWNGSHYPIWRYYWKFKNRHTKSHYHSSKYCEMKYSHLSIILRSTRYESRILVQGRHLMTSMKNILTEFFTTLKKGIIQGKLVSTLLKKLAILRRCILLICTLICLISHTGFWFYIQW